MTTKSGLLPGHTRVCVCAHTHTYHTPSALAQLAAEGHHCAAGTGPFPCILLRAGSECGNGVRSRALTGVAQK